MARPFERPLILNRYRPLETRGEGGFGVVDIAWDTRLQRRVAIKRIALQTTGSDLPGIQEARTAAMLNDAHIVTVLDFEVTGTEALIIMENIDGPTLASILSRSNDLLEIDAIGAIIYGV
ncbi:MAG: serine/threonine protein kinase, partial [Coriobacteriaceae bacterium]|nr:serine/threonine protein kinase [Coriobacteriaceae bacterium]